MKYLAHVKWFVDEHAVNSAALNSNEWLLAAVVLAASVVIALLTKKLWAGFDKQIDIKLNDFRPYIPGIIGVVTGLSLIMASLQDYVFAPNILAGWSWLVTVQYLLGAAILIGFGSRLASIVLLVMYGLLAFDNSWVNLFEHLEYAAGAIFILAYGSGGLLRLINPEKINTHKLQTSAKTYVRLIGLSLMVLAISEKLASPGLSEAFLMIHDWNILAALDISNRHFAVILGTLELVFGLLLVLAIVPRLVVLAILGAMLTTASLLGIQEVYGHIFALGLVAVVWIGYEQLPRQQTKNKSVE